MKSAQLHPYVKDLASALSLGFIDIMNIENKNDIHTDDPEYENLMLLSGLQNYDEFINKTTKVTGYKDVTEIMANGSFKLSLKKNSRHGWWLRNENFKISLSRKIPLKERNKIKNAISSNIVLMTNLSKNTCDLSKIPEFTEFFQKYKPHSIADFTFKSGSNNYEIIEDNDLSSIKVYSHKTQFLIRRFIEELQDNEILLLNFFGIKLDSFSDIIQDEDNILLRTIALSSWYELTNTNTVISLSRNKLRPIQEKTHDLEYLKKLTFLDLKENYKNQILEFLPAEAEKDPKKDFKGNLSKLYDIAKTLASDKDYYLWQGPDEIIKFYGKNLPHLFINKNGRLDLKNIYSFKNNVPGDVSTDKLSLTCSKDEAIIKIPENKTVAVRALDGHCHEFCDFHVSGNNNSHNQYYDFDLNCTVYLDRITMDLSQIMSIKDEKQIAKASEPIQALYYTFMVAKGLVQRGAFIPQFCIGVHDYYFYPDSFKISRWIPAIIFPEIKLLVKKVGSCLRALHLNEFLNHKNYYSYLYVADNLEIGCAFLSMFIHDMLSCMWKENIVHLTKFNHYFISPLFLMIKRADFWITDNNIYDLTRNQIEKRELGFASLPEYFAPLFSLQNFPGQLTPVIKIEEAAENDAYEAKLLFKEFDAQSLSQSESSYITYPELNAYFKGTENAISRDFLICISKLNAIRQTFPFIEDLLTSTEGSYNISAEDLPLFIFETAFKLQNLGFEVLMTKSLSSIVRPKSRLKLNLAKSWNTSQGFFSLIELMKFNWQLSIGDKEITEKDFKKLLSSAGKIINFKNNLVYLTKEDAENLKAQLESKKKQSLSRPLLIAAALSGKYEDEDVIFSTDLKEALQKIMQDSIIEIPQNITASLRPYQERGFNWLMHNLKMGMGSIIADDMGLGKTVQVITALQQLKNDNELNQQKVLIVVPTTLLINWQHELNKFAPELCYKIIYGSNKDLTDGSTDILLTTYSFLVHNQAVFENLPLRVLVIDEAQAIKNHNTQASKALRKIQAKSVIAMTGTPVENHLMEYWSIMDVVNPGLLGSATTFKNDFAIPIEKDRNLDAANLLKTAVSPFVLRRLKTDKNIISDLPDKLSSNQYCYLSPIQSALYQAKLDESLNKLSSDVKSKMINVITTINALKQICDSPAVYDEGNSHNKPEDSGKSVAVLDLLENILDQGKKTIIFTQYLKMGYLLKQYIKDKFAIDADFLTGETTLKERQNMIDSFQNDPDKSILILSLKAGGSGINLTAASVVIHFDLWWNPAVENQATDRAYRIGQNKTVQVYRMLCSGTLEENIDATLSMKKELNELTVKENERWLGELSSDELKQLLSLSGNN